MRVVYPLDSTGTDAVVAGILLKSAPSLLEALKADAPEAERPTSLFSIAFDYRTMGWTYFWQAFVTTVLPNGAQLQREIEPEKPSPSLDLLSAALREVFPSEAICDSALEQDLFMDGERPIYLIED